MLARFPYVIVVDLWGGGGGGGGRSEVRRPEFFKTIWPTQGVMVMLMWSQVVEC